MSASLISTFKKSNITKMKKLTSLAKGNLELQHLLIATVETFVFEQGQIEADGSSLLQASRAKRRKSGSSKEATGEDEAALAQIEVPHGIELRRGLRVFRGWGQRMSLDLILYMRPQLNAQIINWTKDELHRLVEFALDIRLFGPTLDRVGITDKKQLLEILHVCYIRLGSRLTPLVSSIRAGDHGIDWQTHGIYCIDTTGKPQSIT